MKLLKTTIAVMASIGLTMSANAGEKNIVETAASTGDFDTLLQAAEAAGLVEALSDDSSTLTVFAPTDKAFEKLPEGTLTDLLKPENKELLASIIKYHVVPVEVMAADIKPGVIETLNGEKITIAVVDDKVMVDEATVTKTDIETTNGVIHVIDTVIMPE